MALIKCPECGTEVSDKAKQCPKCAYPRPGDMPNNLELNEGEQKHSKNAEALEIPCPHCGKQIDLDNDFCYNCGETIVTLDQNKARIEEKGYKTRIGEPQLLIKTKQTSDSRAPLLILLVVLLLGPIAVYKFRTNNMGSSNNCTNIRGGWSSSSTYDANGLHFSNGNVTLGFTNQNHGYGAGSERYGSSTTGKYSIRGNSIIMNFGGTDMYATINGCAETITYQGKIYVRD